MAVSTIKVAFPCQASKIWEIVTALEDSEWRSDLRNVEVLESGKKFVEYTKSGFATTFTITCFEPCRRYEFDMENDNMKGHWVGIFTSDGQNTTIDFTEDVTAKKVWLKPFVKGYLKKQQSVYVQDLQKALRG